MRNGGTEELKKLVQRDAQTSSVLQFSRCLKKGNFLR